MKKYTRRDPGGTYHIPAIEADGFRVTSGKVIDFAIHGPFVDRLGLYEDLFEEKEIEKLNREQKDKLKAFIKAL